MSITLRLPNRKKQKFLIGALYNEMFFGGRFRWYCLGLYK